jgi:hypothetical protein
MVAPAKLKLIPLPECRQRSDHDCGPAVARSVLRHFGKTPSRVDAVLTPEGTDFDRLAGLFAAHGLGAAMRDRMTVDHLAELTGMGIPVVCAVRWGPKAEGHWVAVRGVGRGRVYLLDPDRQSGGLIDVPAAEFAAAWRDDDRGRELVGFGIAVFAY